MIINDILEIILNDELFMSLNMSDLIDNCLEKINFVKNPSLEDLIESDKETRVLAKKLLK